MSSLEEAYEYIKKNLKENRFIHTLGVVKEAKKLAKINGVSEEKAEMAALCHDIAKNIPKTKMIELMEENNIILNEDEKNSPSIWHSILGPVVAKKELGIEDEEILGAIRWHTTGKENMTKLEKIIYIADMIEPSRDFEGVNELRKVTLENLNKGVLMGITQTINFLIKKGSLIDLNTIKARNSLID